MSLFDEEADLVCHCCDRLASYINIRKYKKRRLSNVLHCWYHHSYNPDACRLNTDTYEDGLQDRLIQLWVPRVHGERASRIVDLKSGLEMYGVKGGGGGRGLQKGEMPCFFHARPSGPKGKTIGRHDLLIIREKRSGLAWNHVMWWGIDLRALDIRKLGPVEHGMAGSLPPAKTLMHFLIGNTIKVHNNALELEWKAAAFSGEGWEKHGGVQAHLDMDGEGDPDLMPVIATMFYLLEPRFPTKPKGEEKDCRGEESGGVVLTALQWRAVFSHYCELLLRAHPIYTALKEQVTTNQRRVALMMPREQSAEYFDYNLDRETGGWKYWGMVDVLNVMLNQEEMYPWDAVLATMPCPY